MEPRVRSAGRSGSPGDARSVQEPVVVQRHGAGVEQVEHGHREHGAGEHGHRPEHPHEQRRGEVERPEPQRPEVAAADHRALHVARRRVRPQRGHEEAGVHVVPRGLDEAGEGGQEADEQRRELGRRHPRRRLAVAGERVRGRGVAAHPRADQRAQRDAQRRQRCGRRDAVGDHAERQGRLLRRRRLQAGMNRGDQAEEPALIAEKQRRKQGSINNKRSEHVSSTCTMRCTQASLLWFS